MAITAKQAIAQGVTAQQLRNCWAWHWDKAMALSPDKYFSERRHHFAVMILLEQTIAELGQ